MDSKRFMIDDSGLNIVDTYSMKAYMFDNSEDCKECFNLLGDIIKRNESLQETLAFRSNQLYLMELLIEESESMDMIREMEKILNE